MTGLIRMLELILFTLQEDDVGTLAGLLDTGASRPWFVKG